MHQFDAVQRPSGRKSSVRQGRLSQDARDILAYLFATNQPVTPGLPMPVSAVEVRIENAVENMWHGGEGRFTKHGGSDSWEYFKHHQDEDWAVVFAWDCDGDPKRGAELLQGLLDQENREER